MKSKERKHDRYGKWSMVNGKCNGKVNPCWSKMLGWRQTFQMTAAAFLRIVLSDRDAGHRKIRKGSGSAGRCPGVLPSHRQDSPVRLRASHLQTLSSNAARMVPETRLVGPAPALKRLDHSLPAIRMKSDTTRVTSSAPSISRSPSVRSHTRIHHGVR